MIHDFYKLMLVTQRGNTSLTDYIDFIRQCASSGVSCVQLREKNAEPAFKLQFALQLKQTLTPFNIPLIINDDLDLALQVNACGVHLGQTDGAPQIAREKLGSKKIIGLSIESEAELQPANKLDLTYVAASAVFPTSNKNNLKTIWGTDGVHRLCKQTKHPLIGIGGITELNVAQVMQAGAQGVAVIGALHEASAPAAMAMTLRNIIDSNN